MPHDVKAEPRSSDPGGKHDSTYETPSAGEPMVSCGRLGLDGQRGCVQQQQHVSTSIQRDAGNQYLTGVID